MPFYEFEDRSPLVDSRAFVHPDAVLIGDVKVAAECYVGAGAVLGGRYRVHPDWERLQRSG